MRVTDDVAESEAGTFDVLDWVFGAGVWVLFVEVGWVKLFAGPTRSS